MRVRAAQSLRTTCVALLVVPVIGLSGCGGDDLSQRELAEIGRLTDRLRVLCMRDAPLVGSEAAPASKIVSRLMQLVRQAPEQHWVVDANDRDTGSTTPAGRMQYVGELLGRPTNPGDPVCSSYLAGRVDQFLADIG